MGIKLEDVTSLRISKTTKWRFEEFGKRGEFTDQILNRLLDELEELRNEIEELRKKHGVRS